MDDFCYGVFKGVTWIVPASCAVGVVLLALLFFLLRRKRRGAYCIRRAENKPLSATEAVHVSVNDQPSVVSQKPVEEVVPDPETEKKRSFEEKTDDFIAAIANPDLAGLLRSRLEDLEDEESEKGRACALVNLLDEMHILEKSTSDADLEALRGMTSAVRNELDLLGAKVIDADEWCPNLQRAVEMRRDLPLGSSPVIADKVASGVEFRGNLCRRQKVILRMPVDE